MRTKCRKCGESVKIFRKKCEPKQWFCAKVMEKSAGIHVNTIVIKTITMPTENSISIVRHTVLSKAQGARSSAQASLIHTHTHTNTFNEFKHLQIIVENENVAQT